MHGGLRHIAEILWSPLKRVMRHSLQREQRVRLLASARLSLFVTAALLFGCGDNNAEIVNEDDVLTFADTPGLVANTCGGRAPLEAEPGSGCGECNTGRWRCDGAETLRCEGGEANACGGCGDLPGRIGDVCGPCDGVWACDALGNMLCTSVEPNACGGCEALDGLPNFACFNGILSCDGPNALVCRAGATNVCGGVTLLEPSPGRACGVCRNGRVACDGPDSTVCLDENLGVNACGGCAPLSGVPEESCGCGGTWQCLAENDLRCVGSASRNACGGCEVLGATPGDVCEDGVVACQGDNAVQCVVAGRNACGGEATLDRRPGEQCGACGDGVAFCESQESLGCAGATDLNACGGCGSLPGEPGALCGVDRLWTCIGNSLVCTPAVERNNCGGTEILSQNPGDSCGECDDGVWICVSREDVGCFGASLDGRNRCGGCASLPNDAIPGAPCGVCFSGTWTCSGEDAIVCAGEDIRTRRTWYADRDGDGHGNLNSPRQACDQPIGWVALDDDCDDLQPDVLPGGTEVCDDLDNDCNGIVDDNWRAWRDEDGDGAGGPGDAVVQCVLEPGYSRRNTDCDDTDPRVFPTQTRGYGEPRNGGGWDFNCDGLTEITLTGRGRCGPAGDCWNLSPFRDTSPGWLEGVDPACGESGTWLEDCSEGQARCIENAYLRLQECL